MLKPHNRRAVYNKASPKDRGTKTGSLSKYIYESDKCLMLYGFNVCPKVQFLTRNKISFFKGNVRNLINTENIAQ